MVEVASMEALEDSSPAIFSVAGRGIALIRWGERVYAMRNVCPHQSQSFFKGGAHERIVAEVESTSEVDLKVDRAVVACPWHSWEFDLETGQCAVDPKLRVAVYVVEVRDGRVYVDAPWAKASTV